jgi:hypothetical protein
VDLFNEKIRQLAALEREKNRMLERLLAFSASMGESGGSAENGDEGSSSDSNQEDDSDELAEDSDLPDLDYEEIEEEIETTEVVEEQIVTLDDVFQNVSEDD